MGFFRYPAFIAVVAGLVNASVKTTVCNGQSYVYQEFAGYGYVPGDARDRFGDSMSFGSSIALDKTTWSRAGNVYQGIMYALPG